MHLELFDVGTVDEHVDVLEHGAVRHLLVAAARPEPDGLRVAEPFAHGPDDPQDLVPILGF